MERRSRPRACVTKMLWALLTVATVVRAEPGAAPAPADAALHSFLRDPELCAYMVSPPDGESDLLLRRYESAAREAVRALRQREAPLSETAALFRLRAACESSLGGAKP